MLLHIPGLFSREEVQRIRQALETADWADGRITAGHQSAKAKHNLQLPEGHPLAKEIGTAMLERLWQNPLFMSAALPNKVFPPLFNCYTAGGSFDFHIDNAVRQARGLTPKVCRIFLQASTACCGSSATSGREAWACGLISSSNRLRNARASLNTACPSASEVVASWPP